MSSPQNTEFNFDTQLHPGSIKRAMNEAKAKSRDLWQVPRANLKIIDNFNVRVKDAEYVAHVRALADSMKSEGFYQHEALAGYVATEDGEQVIYIYDGHCRLEAVDLANSEGAEIHFLPVSVSQEGLSMEDMVVVLVRGNSGKPLTPYETAVVCKRLVRFNIEVPVIATRLGFSEQHINNLLALMASPLDLRKMVIDGVVSATTAIEMINKHGSKALEKLLEAQSRANAVGKQRVTGKHIAPNQAFKKAVRKSAETMFTAITEITADPCYKALSPALREKLDALMATLNQGQIDGVAVARSATP